VPPANGEREVTIQLARGRISEVPLHVRIHPRLVDDAMSRVYPREPSNAGRPILDAYAEILRAELD
jgi:hypothetical protein